MVWIESMKRKKRKPRVGGKWLIAKPEIVGWFIYSYLHLRAKISSKQNASQDNKIIVRNFLQRRQSTSYTFSYPFKFNFHFSLYKSCCLPLKDEESESSNHLIFPFLLASLSCIRFFCILCRFLIRKRV